MPKQICPDCGKEMPTGMPEGFCPNCLLLLGSRAPIVTTEPTKPADSQQEPARGQPLHPRGEKSGDLIGRYKLLQEIGEGGMGTVWMAEQEEPVRRRVALKVVKLGMDTKQVIGRFEAERQALALMDHPNIAKVLDAGATGTGRPYFVMELVKGIPITKYCDDNKLASAARLGLFIEVCRAIQHAHQKGIIHRDIKPTNILIANHDGTPVPKVIDFGIAKATTGQPLTDKTIFTAFEQFIGTPAYMSPEQAEMNALDVDTRSDIYSLGVLLYELLTGKTPFDAQELISAGLDGMRRMIREKEPVRPSTRVSSLENVEQTVVANQRQTEPLKLIHLVRGDLDWIVMKTLEKDRTRRYDTANGLAMDIQRYLNNEPINARPPSQLYRFQKTVRRNKLAFVGAAAVSLALLLGIAGTSWQAILATRYARAANKAKVEAVKHHDQAEQNLLVARRNLYAADMNLVSQAIEVNDLQRARSLLNRHDPKVGESDPRGWEWWRLRYEASDKSTASLPSSTNEVFFSVAFSPDGKTLAVPRAGGVELWDWPAQTLREHLSLPTRKLAFSSSGRLLASSPGNNRIYVHDFTTGGHAEFIATLAGVSDLAISPDEQLLLCCSWGGSQSGKLCYEVIELATKRRLHKWTLIGADGVHFGKLAFFPDGQRVVISGRPSMIEVRRLNDGVTEQRIQVHDENVTSVAVSPDGRWLAVGCGYEENQVRVYDAKNKFQMRCLRGHSGWVGVLAFSRDNRQLVSASADQTVRVWSVPEFAESRVLRGHEDEVWSAAISPDSKTIVSGSKFGELKVWSLEADIRGGGDTVLPSLWQTALSTDFRHFAGLDHAGRAVLGSSDEPAHQETIAAFGTNNYRIDIDPLGSRVVVAERSGDVRLWDRAANRTLTTRLSTNSSVHHLTFLDQGNECVAVSRDKLVSLWSDNLELKHSWRLPAKLGLYNHNIVRETGWFVGAAGANTLAVYDLRSGKQLASLQKDNQGIADLALSRDQRFLVTSDDGGTVWVWDTETWQNKHVLRGSRFGVSALALSPDGQRLATSSGLAVRIWDFQNYQQLADIQVQPAYRHLIRFSDDGRTLAVNVNPRVIHLLRAPESP